MCNNLIDENIDLKVEIPSLKLRLYNLRYRIKQAVTKDKICQTRKT